MTFSQLKVSPLWDGKSWILLEDFSYHSIVVPAGFITDFASVPVAFTWFIRRWGKHGFASIIHNWLYWEQPYSRKFCDLVFLSGMLNTNTKCGRAYLIYYCVRLFGWFWWVDNRKLKRKGVMRYADI